MNFVDEELVVLKKEFDDSNYKRVYKITEIKNNKLMVLTISEKSTDPSKFKENSDNSLLGKELGPFEPNIFEPYF